MKITLIIIGKTHENYLVEGIAIFQKRLKHYCQFELIELKDVKSTENKEDLIKAESDLVLAKISVKDLLILLDERGQQYSSKAFATFIEKRGVSESGRRLVFLIGGAFGVSEIIRQKSEYQLSLSSLTFSHQMIRLFFVEQLYRAFTIIKNEKYHNE